MDGLSSEKRKRRNSTSLIFNTVQKDVSVLFPDKQR